MKRTRHGRSATRRGRQSSPRHTQAATSAGTLALPSPRRLVMDFQSDVREEVSGLLAHIGIVPPPFSTADKAFHALFGVLRRLIVARPRRVVRSGVLTRRALPLAISNVINTIAQKSEAGADLGSFLSTRVERLDTHDLLLNDWGIHHLHVGADVPGPGGYVARSKELLYVLVREEALYMIDVRDHGAFSDAELVEIVHLEWPETIARWRSHTLAADPLSSETRALLRRKHASALVMTSDGTSYFPTGGGYMCSGLSAEVVFTSDRVMDEIEWLERTLMENAETVVADLERCTGVAVQQRRLKLVLALDSGRVVAHVVDEATKVGLRLSLPQTTPAHRS